MSLMKVFNISGGAVSAQSQRLNVVASNLANADSVAGPDGQPYKARQVMFQTQMMDAEGSAAGVRVASVVEDGAVPRRLHDPDHPLADENGYVTMTNVNVVEEMVNMIETQRAYEINSKAISAVDGMLRYLNNNM